MTPISMRQIRYLMGAIFLAAFSTMTLLTGCPATVNNQNQPTPNGQTVIVPATEFPDWPQDPLEMTALNIEANNLAIDLKYSGGCRDHTYALVVADDVAESLPPQMTAILSHDDPDDPCDAIIGETANFDLRPVRDYLQNGSGGSGSVIITIRAGDQTETIQYNY